MGAGAAFENVPDADADDGDVDDARRALQVDGDVGVFGQELVQLLKRGGRKIAFEPPDAADIRGQFE